MPTKFTDKLVQDIKACFLEEHGVVLSDEQAIEALDALGGLFLAIGGEGGAAVGASAPPTAGPPLT